MACRTSMWSLHAAEEVALQLVSLPTCGSWTVRRSAALLAEAQCAVCVSSPSYGMFVGE